MFSGCYMCFCLYKCWPIILVCPGLQGLPICETFNAKSGIFQANWNDLVTLIFNSTYFLVSGDGSQCTGLSKWKSSPKFCYFWDKYGRVLERETKVSLAVKCELWSVVNLQQILISFCKRYPGGKLVFIMINSCIIIFTMGKFLPH